MVKEYIRNKTIYIVSDELKREILSQISESQLLLDIHFFSVPEIIKRCYFDFDYKSIHYLAKHFNLSYENAKTFISNMKYLIYSNPIKDSKYEYLLNMKEYLDSENLLVYDYNFLNFLSNYNIVTDLDFSMPFLTKINELLNNKIELISNEKNNNTIIYEYIDSENEIEDLANKICDLLSNNITPDKIHILNYNKDYYSYINKIFTLYNIPFNLNSNSHLYDLKYIKELYSDYINNVGLEFNDKYQSLNNSFIDCLNSLSFIEDKEEKNDFLLYLLKNYKIKDVKYDNVVKFDNSIGLFLKDHYYFFIGLNNKVFPSYLKDDDYFSDINKAELGYLTSYKINTITKKFYIDKLKSDANLNISYRNSDYFNKYSKSDIVEEVSSSVISNKSINKYSFDYNKLKLVRELDTFYKYDIKSDELTKLLELINKKEYKSYDNSYTKIDSDTYISDILDKQISISYSSLEKYNECNFKYYLDTLIKESTTTFNTYVGNLFHHVLEKVYEPNFDFNNEVNSYESEYELSNIESILLENLLEEFKEKIEIIKEQYQKTDFKNVKQELHLSIYKKSVLSNKIHGFIDKIMFDNDNNAFVVDYKTGDTKLTLDYLDYGLKCQLPFYFYLLNKSKEYADIFLVGCYLQVLNFKIKSINDKGKDMLLEGYSFNNEEMIAKIDHNYEENSYIKGIKPNKNGLGTYSKTFDKDLFNEIVIKMENNIENMINGIEMVDFNINPKILKDNSTTCKYCKYKDICFHTFNDYVDLREGDEDEVDQ